MRGKQWRVVSAYSAPPDADFRQRRLVLSCSVSHMRACQAWRCFWESARQSQLNQRTAYDSGAWRERELKSYSRCSTRERRTFEILFQILPSLCIFLKISSTRAASVMLSNLTNIYGEKSTIYIYYLILKCKCMPP